MNLAFSEQLTLAHMSPAQQEIIKQIVPDLRTFTLYHNDGKYQDIDFFFEGNNNAHSITEFTEDTANRLETVLEIVIYCKLQVKK